ncbi:MAG TPA: hypothetical protein VE338_03935, partial [Ktedonobacterales bacterium]|nr:hypothetical protein [Ktedonobacterales bacterium]
MLAKIAALTQSKVAIAALGVVLVGGGGGAVAVAATTGHLSTLGVNLNSANGASSASDSHAHTVGVEGLLVSCSATTPPASIVVKDSKGVQWTFAVSATTKLNGDTETSSEGASSESGASSTHTGGSSTDAAGASSAKGDNSAHTGGSSTSGAGASSAKGDNSASAETGGSSQAGDNSAHAAPTLATICAAAGSHDVQVQATHSSSG